MKQIEDNFSKCSMWTHGVLNISLKILEELSDRDNIEDEEKIEPDYYIDRPVIIWTKYIACPNICAKPRRRRQEDTSQW